MSSCQIIFQILLNRGYRGCRDDRGNREGYGSLSRTNLYSALRARPLALIFIFGNIETAKNSSTLSNQLEHLIEINRIICTLSNISRTFWSFVHRGFISLRKTSSPCLCKSPIYIHRRISGDTFPTTPTAPTTPTTPTAPIQHK